MGAEDTGWDWWEVIDIFTSVDEQLANLVELSKRNNELLAEMSGWNAGGDGETEGEVLGVIRGTPITDLPITGNDFEQRESEDDVTIQPGHNDDVLKVNFEKGSAGLWYEVGTNDEQYSEYQYLRDGVNILQGRMKEPLGIYNDPYRFPQPIISMESISINVRRSADAPSSGDYYSKVRYIPISKETANLLNELWNKV